MLGPCLHQCVPFLEQITPLVCGMRFPAGVRQRGLANVVGCVRLLAGPIAETGAEAVHGDARVHVLQHHQHGQTGKRFAALEAGKHEFVEPGCDQFLDDGDATWRQRHPMFLLRLQALGRNGPHLGGQVEFVERGPDRLARAHCRQYGELEGERADTFLGSAMKAGTCS